jgi:hypothetical protein
MSRTATTSWIQDRKAKAKPNEKAIWDRWGVQEADLDANPDTEDNVIVFDDVQPGKVKAIDGYHFIPRSKIEQRVFYNTFPQKSERKKISAEDKKLLRQYLRKYPTADEQQDHPIEEFEVRTSAFDLVRTEVKSRMGEIGVNTYSKAKPD